MNRVELIGNVTKDVDLIPTSTGKSMVAFNLAVRREYTDQNGDEITDFHYCVAFDKLAETIHRYVQKGNKLFVAGELVYDSYEDRQGIKKTTTKIMLRQIEFLTPKSSSTPSKKEDKKVCNPHPEDLTPIEDTSLPF